MSVSDLIPVNLLTGFLGSGKTTLLQRLLRSASMANTAVLINEFGEVGIDHLLIQEVVDEEVVLLQSGCVCCTIRGDLKDALLRLDARRRRGEVPAFSRLVIETTGLADPAPIVATFSADPMLRHHYRLGNIVTVVDAEEGTAHLADYEEARRQAAVADRLVVSKTDIAAPGKTARLAAALARINPAAAIVESGEDDEAASELLTSDLHDLASRSAEVQRWLAAERLAEEHHHHDIDRSRHGDIRALVITANASTLFARLVAGSITLMFFTYAFVNMAMVSGLLPIVGVPLPLISFGGTALVSLFIGLGILMNVQANRKLVTS